LSGKRHVPHYRLIGSKSSSQLFYFAAAIREQTSSNAPSGTATHLPGLFIGFIVQKAGPGKNPGEPATQALLVAGNPRLTLSVYLTGPSMTRPAAVVRV
jgi:hypothetical protein